MMASFCEHGDGSSGNGVTYLVTQSSTTYRSLVLFFEAVAGEMQD
jgi:hypothetical protein